MLEGQSDGIDLLRRAARKRGNGSMFDLAVFSVAFAQKIAGVFFTVLSAGGGVDIQSEYLVVILVQ